MFYRSTTFIIRVIAFLGPLIFLYLGTVAFYSTNQDGDLLRIGYIRKDEEYRKAFQHEFTRPIYFDDLKGRLSRMDSPAEQKKIYSVLVIGDSFSKGRPESYINYLAE